MKVYSGEEKNRAILSDIITVVVALSQRNIPFRGHRWDTITKTEDGNFDYFVHWLAKQKPVLKAHLEMQLTTQNTSALTYKTN